MRTIPGMVVMCPADDIEARACVRAAAEHEGPVYIRFGRAACPVVNDRPDYKFELGKGTVLREGKDVFYIYTHGAPKGNFLKAMREIATQKHCKELGEYRCLGYDTFGPFKLVGGIAKGHPTEEEITRAVNFYENLI